MMKSIDLSPIARGEQPVGKVVEPVQDSKLDALHSAADERIEEYKNAEHRAWIRSESVLARKEAY